MSEDGFSTKEILVRVEAKVDLALAQHDARITSVESFIARAKGALALTVVLLPLLAVLLR